MTTIPPEIVYQILTYQFRDFMSNDHPNSPEKYNENLKTFLRSNLTVNKNFYHICKVLMYRYCNFTTAKRFNTLLHTIKEHKELGNLIEVADFQELTSIGLGRTGEMNKMIKNLTNETLLDFLKTTQLTLREFLACEHIQGDLDAKIIYFLLRPGTVLSVLDFCGCSGVKFTESFIIALEKLYHMNRGEHEQEPIEQNYQITCLGMNDCTDLPAYVITRTLKMLPEIQKLDLSHTSIDDDTLVNIPHLKNLTHLSFGMCLQLTVRGVLEFFAHHPSVTDANNSATLEWLNLGVSSLSSSWTEVHTMFLLKKLCRYGHNKTLQYLNIGGLPLHESEDTTITVMRYFYKCQDTLHFIKWNFPSLKSLSIRDNNIPISKLCSFLKFENIELGNDDNQRFPTLEKFELILKPKCQSLKYLSISNNSYINRWTIQDSSLYTCSESLVALEVSFDAWQSIEKLNERHEFTSYQFKKQTSIIKDISDATLVKWKCYIDSSYGRRYWLYKVDPQLNKDDIDFASNLVKYDSSGNKIIEIIKQPDFLKYAQTKIMLGCGLVPLSTVRRKQCYRDLKPPISHFLTRNGGVSLGETAAPIITPRLPPGGWRIMHSDDQVDSNNQSEARIIDRPAPLEEHRRRNLSDTFSSGLYWDRSIQDLPSMAIESQLEEIQLNNDQESAESMLNQQRFEEELEENDDEYLNDPELQRRRSQLSLMRSAFSHHSLNLKASTIPQSRGQHFPPWRKTKNHFRDHPEEFVYDNEDSDITKRYRLHFALVNEYQVFGTIERGMYRYYSLKT